MKPLLDAASVPATIVNWAGDEVVSIQDMVAHGAGLLGVPPRIEVTEVPGASIGSAADPARRKAITGPCRVPWREGIRRVLEELYPDRVRPVAATDRRRG